MHPSVPVAFDFGCVRPYTDFDRHSDYQADHMEVSKVGKRGAVVVPARLRRKFGIEEGGLVVAEERPEGILIRPATAVPVEIYTAERKAELLLSNAVDAKDYQAAVAEVRKLGIDPAKIPHRKPSRS
jgi:AbrB family looped-hinge helix DNA binding protein